MSSLDAVTGTVADAGNYPLIKSNRSWRDESPECKHFFAHR